MGPNRRSSLRCPIYISRSLRGGIGNVRPFSGFATTVVEGVY